MTLRMNEGSSVRIQVPKGFPDEIKWKCKELTELYTIPEKRGQGFAEKLMQEVCQEADKSHFPLLLHVKPYKVVDNDTGITDSKRLQAFYARHGFVVFQAKPVILMCRTPKKVE